MRKLLLISICTILFFSCSNTKELESKITELEQALDECQNGADKVFGKLQNAFESENHKEVISLYATLLDKHPGSSESKSAKDIVIRSEEIIERTELEEIEKRKKSELEEKERLEKERKEKLASLNKLKKSFDDVSGVTWYKQPYFIHYTNHSKVSIYMGQRGSDTPWINLMMSYAADDWIFFTNAYLSYDGETREIAFDKYDDKETDNDSGGISEWIVRKSISPAMIGYLEEFAKSPNAKVRFTGKYTKTRVLSANERKGITDVINGYKALNRL